MTWQHQMVAFNRPAKWGTPLVAAAVVVAICTLNLNGLTAIVFGVNQLFTIPLLICSIYLVVALAKTRIDADLRLLMAAISLYFVIGLVVGAEEIDWWEIERSIMDYGACILLVLATYFAVHRANCTGNLQSFLRFFILCAFVASAGILVSDQIYNVSVFVPLSGAYRKAGFFANPNEAGVVALMGVGASLYVRGVSSSLRFLVFAVSVVAVHLTYSKAAALGTIMLLGLYFFVARSPRRSSAAAGFAKVSAGVALLCGIALLTWDRSNISALNLSREQEIRLIQVADILQGRVDEETTTHRSDLWGVAVERIAQRPLFGWGLRTFHSLEGGVMGEEGWLGVHNTFLMVAGESGLIALIALLLFVLLHGRRMFRHRCWESLAFFVPALIAMMTTHGALGLRFVAVAIGVSVALTSIARRRDEESEKVGCGNN